MADRLCGAAQPAGCRNLLQSAVFTSTRDFYSTRMTRLVMMIFSIVSALVCSYLVA